MTIFTLLFCITFTIVFAYDWVDFPHNFVARILSFFWKKDIDSNRIKLPKIFECSLCATFWISLITLLCVAPKYAFFAIVAAFSTKYIYYTIKVFDALISKIFALLERLISKL